jgi:hypothetical protein
MKSVVLPTHAGKRQFMGSGERLKPENDQSSLWLCRGRQATGSKIKSLQMSFSEIFKIWCPGPESNPARGISPAAQPANRLSCAGILCRINIKLESQYYFLSVWNLLK